MWRGSAFFAFRVDPVQAAAPQPFSDWKVIPLTEEWEENLVHSKVTVYKDKSTRSGKVKTLSSGSFMVSEFHARRIADPKNPQAVEAWAKVTKPVAGWVQYSDISSHLPDFGLFYNGKPLDDFTAALIKMMNDLKASGTARVVSCSTDGRKVLSEGEKNALRNSYGGEDPPTWVSYYQKSDTFYAARVAYSESDDEDEEHFIIYSTKDRNLVFPGGFKVGDPVSRVPSSITGKYSSRIEDGARRHFWTDQWEFSIMEDKNGNIGEVTLVDAHTLAGVKLNENYAGFLRPQPAQQSKPAQQLTPRPGGVQYIQRDPKPATKKPSTAETLFGKP
jgi:hypothetical protein